jgi:hypothetical protein
MSLRTILMALAVLVAALVVLSWAFSATHEFGWLHLAGLAVSVALLAAIFFGRVGGQPSRPPD